jgi:hypothetical protein
MMGGPMRVGSPMNLLAVPRPAVVLLALALAAPARSQAPTKPKTPAPPQAAAAQAAAAPLRSAVGMPSVIEDLVLPGGELEAAPATPANKVIVRIEDTARHGTAFRYRIWFTGLEPGQYDLGQFLVRKDRTPVEGLPKLPVQIDSVLAEGRMQPNALAGKPAPFLGGYQTALWVAGAVWVAGLFAILFVGRRRKAAAAAVAPPLTLAERLRPIVEDALAGTLPPARRAELERLLLGFWRRRLDLEGRPAAEAIARLRGHAEAGQLLQQLELWLHAPPQRSSVDVELLLRPYAALPADAAERPAGSPAVGGAAVADRHGDSRDNKLGEGVA